MRKIVRMTDAYDAKIKQMSKRLDGMIATMDLYAKYEITAQGEISENLLYADSMKALDRAGKRLNDKHKKNPQSVELVQWKTASGSGGYFMEPQQLPISQHQPTPPKRS